MVIFVLVVVVGIIFGFVSLNNRIIRMKRLTDNAWADVDVFLKRRAELVPNLVATVKGASQYEQSTLEQVVAARSNAMAISAPTPEKAAAESQLTSTLVRTVALAEAYPTLQANQNFLKLQSELSDVEDKIASARQYYNACVRDYNVMLESFPSSVIAQTAGMKTKDFFEIEDLTERIAPTVAGV
ncbi:LemA family protein [soil metagenome]